jgi:hypothetical protein
MLCQVARSEEMRGELDAVKFCSTYQTQNFAMAKETYAQVVGREADDERAGWCRCIGGRRSESELRQTMAVEDD